MKDPRLLTVEIAVANLREVPVKLLKDFDLKALTSEVQSIVYSFLSLEELEDVGMLSRLEEAGKDLKRAWMDMRGSCSTPGDKLNAARVRFASSILSGIRRRVGREKRIYSGTDCFWGTILSFEEFDGLRITLVDAGERYEVVTNIDVKEGRMPLAILPPRRFGRFVSEAMFIEAEGSGKPGEPAIPTEREKGAIESVLREEANRLGIKI